MHSFARTVRHIRRIHDAWPVPFFSLGTHSDGAPWPFPKVPPSEKKLPRPGLRYSPFHVDVGTSDVAHVRRNGRTDRKRGSKGRVRGAMSARKDTAIELKGCIDQAVRVKLAGGREGGWGREAWRRWKERKDVCADALNATCSGRRAQRVRSNAQPRAGRRRGVLAR
eukprot:scaffold689_cov333-Pavlova_lutheri.AAC.10